MMILAPREALRKVTLLVRTLTLMVLTANFLTTNPFKVTHLTMRVLLALALAVVRVELVLQAAVPMVALEKVLDLETVASLKEESKVQAKTREAIMAKVQ